MPDLQELHSTNELKVERIYSFGLQTVYLLRPEPWAALDHTSLLYTALGDTVKKGVLITSVKCCEKLLDQNSVKATDIRTKTRRNIAQ